MTSGCQLEAAGVQVLEEGVHVGPPGPEDTLDHIAVASWLGEPAPLHRVGHAARPSPASTKPVTVSSTIGRPTDLVINDW